MARWLFLLCGMCLMLSCSQSNTNTATPADLKVVIGEGGGFTGLWHGFTVEPGGVVQRWRGPIPEGDPEPAGELSAEDLGKLWTAIEGQGFFSMPEGESGNLTRFLQVTARGQTRRVQWVPQPKEAERRAKPAILFSQCQEVLQVLEETKAKAPRMRKSQ